MKLESEVIEWASNKGLLVGGKDQKYAQFTKAVEELAEVGRAIAKNDKVELVDGIGDVLVTLIIQAALWDIDLDSCLQVAYDEISSRTGKTVNGVFVKD